MRFGGEALYGAWLATGIDASQLGEENRTAHHGVYEAMKAVG